MNKTETIPLCELNYHVIKTNCMKKKQITTLGFKKNNMKNKFATIS